MSKKKKDRRKVLGKAFVTICNDCSEETYGTHNTYSTFCVFCNSKNVRIKKSDVDVLGDEEE